MSLIFVLLQPKKEVKIYSSNINLYKGDYISFYLSLTSREQNSKLIFQLCACIVINKQL